MVRTVLAALLATCASASTAFAQGPPLNLPLHDPAYTVLEGLENAGCAAARVSAYRPYEIERLRAALRRAASDPLCAASLLTALIARFDTTVQPGGGVAEPGQQLPATSTAGRAHVGASATVRSTALGRGEYRPLWRGSRDTGEGDPRIAGIARVRARYAPTARTVGVIEAFAQSHIRNDPTVRARVLRTTTGAVGISEATFAGAFGPITLSIGRDREAWFAEGTESLLLSANSAPLDRLAAAFATTHFEGRAIYASLDDVVLDTLRGELPSETPPQRFHRSLVGHALTWRPSPALELSVGETILLSRGARTIELGYANPLMPYILTQHDAGTEGGQVRDNLLVYAGMRARAGRAQLNAEFLVDDIQIDAADRESIPHQLGWRIEARQGWGSIMPGSFGVEYQRVDSYTYLRGLYTDVYQYLDNPLGSELGPDADRLQASLEAWPAPELYVRTGIGVWRQGAQRIDRRPAEGAVGNAGGGFPSTTDARPFAQRATLLSLAAEITRWQFPVRAHVEVARMQHPAHASTGTANFLRAHVSATYAFRYP